MLLSAGHGTRLRPLSDIRPKPLFPVLNEPMLDFWLKKLRAAGVRKVVVNIHHLSGMMEDFLERAKLRNLELLIVISKETQLLGTGGGLQLAMKHFPEPFFVINSDIYTDFPLESLVSAYEERPGHIGVLAALVRPQGTVSVDPEGEILAFRESAPVKNESERLYGMGLMLLHPESLRGLAPGVSDIITHLGEKIAAGWKLSVVTARNNLFSDIGTIDEYFNLNARLARGGHYVEEGAQVEGSSSGFLLCESGAVIERGAVVMDSILWSGAYVESGAHLKSMVVAGRARAGLRMEGGVITGV